MMGTYYQIPALQIASGSSFMNKKGIKRGDHYLEESAIHSRQLTATKMKWNTFHKYSVLVSLLLILSIGSIVLPSIRLQASDVSNGDSVSALEVEPAHIFLQTRTEARQSAFRCDRSDYRTDICYMSGDVRLFPGNSTFLVLYSNDTIWNGEEVIKPYARKWDHLTLSRVKSLTLRSQNATVEQHPSTESGNPSCDVTHRSPLLVFSTGGYTGNPYHDFNDVIIPLFINSRKYAGQVVFGVTDTRDWWMDKFSSFFKILTAHDILEIDSIDQVHCFQEATVGLRVHGELEINPSDMETSGTMKDFQQVLDQAFGEPGASYPPQLMEPTRLSCLMSNLTTSFTNKFHFENSVHIENYSQCRLQLVIFARQKSRTILNHDEVVALARDEGFNVEVLEPSGTTELTTLYRSLHRAHVMIGVHGAALAHMLFMRPRSVIIQIVPIGTDWPAYTFYEKPAKYSLDMQYLEYRISPEESTLSQYSINSVAITDPETFVGQDWETRKKVYLEKQNVRLSLHKVHSILRKAKRLALKALQQ